MEFKMSVLKVKEHFQITLPASARKRLKVAVGDYVEAESRKEGILIKPARTKDSWFHSKEWQDREQEADEAIAKGEVIGPFDNAKDAINALKKAKV
jgi:AbrB family looped-hinge helix DNA binding protein